ncbi:peptidyl-trna hydrolase signature 2 [Trichococcus palustris]|jgi:peptidyl-tRNA hydrolase, PTH1 family|uniref:Peptidyl-tRNA hydrolase n=1 Tax=Trichococcus palustris TaxID=140314 RepID=A0A143YP57_9LACT|nr:aminoacyl-tRNA hydrolase [Trichococcus palustris]CZQ93172.1 peptidyl-trna hydrolase signature 2 [Trichococcus palustris]SFK84731.1 peptidyl-tRNA hydrolase, PTH1 family [Trichococcus palustris]
MKMIVGLGNPGPKYADTKHNVGFITVDEWAAQNKQNYNKNKFEALYLETTVNGEKVLFVKPLTFMNESGRAVRPLMDYFNVGIEDLVVVYDDMDMPVGKIRLRQKGSAGGHNGIKSLIQHLGTQDFNRIRVGIGRPQFNMTVIQHVLSPFPKIEQEDVLFSVRESVDAINYFIEGHTFLDTMNQFNKKS